MYILIVADNHFCPNFFFIRWRWSWQICPW